MKILGLCVKIEVLCHLIDIKSLRTLLQYLEAMSLFGLAKVPCLGSNTSSLSVLCTLFVVVLFMSLESHTQFVYYYCLKNDASHY